MDIYSSFATRFEHTREEELSLEEYLALCKAILLAYATAAERMLKAIGEPEQVDTRNDPRLSRLFANKVIKIYPAFARVLRHGRRDRAGRVATSATPRRGSKRRSRSSICSARWAAARARSPSG